MIIVVYDFLSYIARLFKPNNDTIENNPTNPMRTMLVDVMNGGQAMFQSFGTDIYMSDYINNCIDRIASEISKIQVCSIVNNGLTENVQNDEITALFRNKPNPLQTTKDFLSSIEWLRRKDMNAFIYPVYDWIPNGKGGTQKYFTAFYPLAPTRVEIGPCADGTVAIRFYFVDGTITTLPYEEIIHLRWRRGKNLLIGGGNDLAMKDDGNVVRTLNILNDVLEAYPKAFNAALKIRAVQTIDSMLDTEGLKNESTKLEEKIEADPNGIVSINRTGTITPLDLSVPVIPNEILRFLKDIIHQRYGISEAILNGDYTAEQHEAFYQNCVQDFIVEFEQAFSYPLFTSRETALGHTIKCYYDQTQYMSTADKLLMAQLARDTGFMTLNQVAGMLGIPPYEGGDIRLQSLNYVNQKIIDTVQLKNASEKGTGK